MGHEPVHAYIRGDAEQMQGGGVRLGVPHRREQLFVGEERLFANRLGDAHRLLVDDPAGAEVLVADLAVAHRSVGQSDVLTGGMNQHVRILSQQPVRHRRPGQGGRNDA